MSPSAKSQPTGSPGEKWQLELPAPDPGARAHSDTLVARIREEIEQAGGALSFERYMELALYAPGLGYYSAGMRKFGPAGDFVTAPELSPLFSRCVAVQVAEALEYLEAGQVLEVGAGRGSMASEVIQALPRSSLDRYFILERSAELRARQERRLAKRLPDAPLTWLDDMPQAGFRGVVLANELLDAYPVRRFCISESGVEELYVGWEGGRFIWKIGTPEDPATLEAIRRIEHDLPGPLPSGYVSELAPARTAWIREMVRRVKEGVILIFDYGYARPEYYHPQRAEGTLACYYRHRMHADPLILTGLQDITSHVDFSAIAEAAVAAGATVAGFTTQANFLMSTGLMEMARGMAPDSSEYAQTAAHVKRLTLPGEMGELVKVMALSRGFDQPLCGFSGRDFRARLQMSQTGH